MGYLTGAITPATRLDPVADLRARFPRFTTEALESNRPVVELLQRVGARRNATPGKWRSLGCSPRALDVPIPGTTKLTHLDENLGAVDVELTRDDLQEIEDGFSRLRIHGARTDRPLAAGIDEGALVGTTSEGGYGRSRYPH